MVIENLFLIFLGLIWIVFAVIQDLKKREIANWLNFSLVIFALAFRFFYSLFNDQGFGLFYQGMIGFGILFLIGNLFYYGKVFAGGDAKLMIALGAVIPFSNNFYLNLNSIFIFLIFFLVAGAFYGIILSIFLVIKNKRRFYKEFSKQFIRNKTIFYIFAVVGLIFIVFAFFQNLFLYLGILIFISPYVYFSAKSIDESCMIRKLDTNKLTEGDWLYKSIKIGNKFIEARWSGLNKEEIALLRKRKKKVLIRQGIPFSPVFLISYLGLIYLTIFQKLYLF